MPTVSTYVDVEVDLDDFDDDELVEELQSRGLHIYVAEYEEDAAQGLFEDVIAWYKRGNTQEALIQLEKIIPDLYGISGKVKE
jgi:hypothetical protein